MWLCGLREHAVQAELYEFRFNESVSWSVQTLEMVTRIGLLRALL